MNPRPHILILAEWYPNPEDPQLGIFIQKQAEAAAQFANVTVVHVHGVKQQKEKILIREKFQGVKVIQASYRKSWFRFLHIHRYTQAMKKIRKMLPDVDLIHLQVIGRNYLAAKFIFKGVPFVITEHWSGYLLDDNDTLIGETFTKEAIQNAKGISAVSDILANKMEQRFGRKGIAVIPNIIEKHNGPSERKDPSTRMLMVADLVDEIKNVSGVLEALKKIQPKESFRFDIIGDGPDRSFLEKMASGIVHPSIKIRFMGRQTNDQVLREIQQSDFLVVNSRRETFSMVSAESLMAGVPVIATRCGGPESFVHPGNGILIDVDHTGQLREAIEFMIHSHSAFDKKAMAENISRKFSKESVQNSLKLLYGIVNS